MAYKIAFFIQNMSRGAGSERVTALIANGLAECGYEVSIISVCGENTCFYPLNKSIFLHTLIKKDNVDNKRYFFKVKKALEGFLSDHKVDLIIDVFAAMSVYSNLVKKQYGIKNITWEHYNYLNNTGMYWVNRRIAIKRSDYIITLTETDKNYYLSNNPKLSGKIDYIYNPSPYQNVTFEEQHENTVAAIGRLIPLKGFHHLLDVWRIVEDNNDSWLLKIVGAGQEEINLKRKAEELKLKRVVFTGATNKVEQIYKEASILVSTSDKEGLPMTMIEAQSFGLPIVSFDYETGPKEIITNNMDGYIVFEKDLNKRNEQMAAYILKLMQDDSLRKKMSSNSYSASRRFATEPIVKKWDDLIKNIMDSVNGERV